MYRVSPAEASRRHVLYRSFRSRPSTLCQLVTLDMTNARRDFDQSDLIFRERTARRLAASQTRIRYSPLAVAGCCWSPVPSSRTTPAHSEDMRGDSPPRRRPPPVSCDWNEMSFNPSHLAAGRGVTFDDSSFPFSWISIPSRRRRASRAALGTGGWGLTVLSSLGERAPH